jgi:HEAT repeat protein
VCQNKTSGLSASRTERRITAASEPQAALLPQHPPIVDWLEALGHDSPFERNQDPSIWDQAAPRLALVPILISLLKDANRDVRVRVLTALGNLGEQVHRVMPVLRAALKETALKDDDESVRTHATHALLQVGPEPDSDVAGLTDSLQSELEVLRFHAAAALGSLGRNARLAVPALIRVALRDEDPAVRVEAAAALWKIDRKGPLVIPALIDALADDNELICWIAADCLGQIGPEAQDAVPALRRALLRSFKIGLIRKGVALALQRINGQTA